MGELFRSSNFGASYTQANSEQMIASTDSRTCFTATAGLLYSLHAEPNSGITYPVKSTDNGVSWTAFAGLPSGADQVYSIFADYNTPQRVIYYDYGKLWLSNDGGTTVAAVHSALTGNGLVVGGVFFSGNMIYVGTNDGVLVSTNGGSSWMLASITGIPSGEVIYSFAAAKVGATTRMYCLTTQAGSVYGGITLHTDYWGLARGVYACDYQSTQWVKKSTALDLSTFFPACVRMAENNIDTVYLAGGGTITGGPTVFKSSNAGASWVEVLLLANNQNVATGWAGEGGFKHWSYGEVAMGFAVAPSDAQRLLFTDYGFVHKSTDGGANWSQAYQDASTQNPANTLVSRSRAYKTCGLENTSVWQMVWSDKDNVFAAYSDMTGVRSTDGGATWSFDYTGNTANTTYRIAKAANGTLFAATSNVHDMYQSTRLKDAQLDVADANGKLIYSTNKGASWSDLKVFGHPVVWVALDPGNAEVAYASVVHYAAGGGVGGIYRTANLSALAGATWTQLSDPVGTEKHPYALEVLKDGKLVATYSGRRNAAGAFTPSSGVFVYTPGSNSWTNVSDPGMRYWTRDVVIDPSDTSQNTWYVNVCSGWGGAPNGLGGLYKTSNRGSSSTKLTGTKIDRALSCTIHPGNSDHLYVTTEGQGLWVSTNTRAATPVFSKVTSYVFQQPERVFFNPFKPAEMCVTSFGNGLKVGSTN